MTQHTKNEITAGNLFDFCHQNKISIRDGKLIAEAYRRKHFLNENGFNGLGYPTQYKSKYFRAFHNEIKRVLNWYILTNSGKELLSKMEDFFKLPENQKEKDVKNLLLFSL